MKYYYNQVISLGMVKIFLEREESERTEMISEIFESGTLANMLHFIQELFGNWNDHIF